MTMVLDGTTGIDLPAPLPIAEGGTGVNNAKIFTEYAESTPVALTYPLTTPKTIAHGLTGIPKLYTVSMRCKITEQNWAVNDEIPITNGQDLYTVGNWRTGTDATNITVVGTGSTIVGSNKTTGALFTLTAANWEYVVRAWR